MKISQHLRAILKNSILVTLLGLILPAFDYLILPVRFGEYPKIVEFGIFLFSPSFFNIPFIFAFFGIIFMILSLGWTFLVFLHHFLEA